jgi:hypothetical protein
MVVTATQIRVKGMGGLFWFFRTVGPVKEQLSRAEGVLFVKLRGFRTLTGWESHEAMKAFRNHGPHREAMKRTGRIGSTKSVTWESVSEPAWQEAVEKLKKVNFPD